MNKTITIIPVHHAKLHWAIGLLNSWRLFSKNDIAFVFCSHDGGKEDERRLKKHIEHMRLSAKQLNIPFDFDFKSFFLPISWECPNIITSKKFYGLNSVFLEGYTHAGVMDVESQLVRWIDTDVVYPGIYDNKILKCNFSLGGGNIVKACAEAIDLSNDTTINMTKNYTQYWWFNEMCIYETKDFFEFQNYIQPFELTIKNQSFCFDYLLYGIYLLNHKGFVTQKVLENIEYAYGALEHNHHNIHKESEAFMSIVDRNIRYDLHEHIKIQMQLDR
jgi:hypothetical protein